MDLLVRLNVCVLNLQRQQEYNRQESTYHTVQYAAISLKISDEDWAEFNYCETVAVSRTFFFPLTAENEIRANASVI